MNIEKIAQRLKDKGNLKQEVYGKTLQSFETLKEIVSAYANHLQDNKSDDDKYDIEYKTDGSFEASIKFAGDVLIFNMHTNIFGFESDYFIHNTDYVKQDPSRQYCGMIEVYNFLADSFKYSRVHDVGYMIARIFINKEGHFFVEGQEQLGFLYKEFDNLVLTEDFLSLIVENAMMYAIGFDLWTPKYQQVKTLTVGQKMQLTGTLSQKTGKRVGFSFAYEDDKEG